jgi:hypothetical protein
VANDEKQDEIIDNDYDEDDHSRMITPHDCSDSDESEEDILNVKALAEEGAPGGQDDSLLAMMKNIASNKSNQQVTGADLVDGHINAYE